MNLNANSLRTNLLVTCLVLLMVFIMPWADRLICRKLGLNLRGGVSTHPRADALLRLRQGLLYTILITYLLVLSYLVLFSRTASESYKVHIALYEDLQNAVEIDFSLLHVLRLLITEGPAAALSHIQVVKPEDITQVYMNMMLFVPMGYLLPYTSRWCRNRVWTRPVMVCFLIAVMIENLQLIFRLGLYDMDDMVSNSIGGLIGELLFIALGYVVTHPGWYGELRDYRRWRRHAWKSTLYPYSRRIGTIRTTLWAASEEEIRDFYVSKLGFRLVRRIDAPAPPETDLLLEMGRMQLEVHCLNRPAELEGQVLNLTVSSLRPVMKRLRGNGIEPGSPKQDPYTGLRCILFQGPDQATIRIIEG